MEPIKTAAAHERALAEIERLAAMNPEPGTPEGNRLEVLATLVQAYENEHFPIERPTPLEAIEFRMHQLGLKPRDLQPYIGSRSKVSEVLSGKRPLTLRMIRALTEGLDIPADVLLQEPRKELPDDAEIEWERFPLREMWKREWISEPLESLEDRAEEVMRAFFEPVASEELLSALYKKTVFAERSGRRMDTYALVAWTARVLQLARKQPAKTYKAGIVTYEFMRDVAQCSWSQQGPLLAQEFLSNHGIKLVVERHLPKTYLDGSALLSRDGQPIVGMSLRHDRIDNFWFVLLHELAHIACHLHKGVSFFDDLDASSEDIREKEADELAQDALIPRAIWSDFRTKPVTPGRVRELASELTIHPAIVAGRWRHDEGDYRLSSRMVGRGQVRKLFST